MTVPETDHDVVDQIRIIREEMNLLIKRTTIKEFYTTAEVAKLRNLEPKTVRDYCWLGFVRGIKLKKHWVIPNEELLRWDREGLLTPTKREKVDGLGVRRRE